MFQYGLYYAGRLIAQIQTRIGYTDNQVRGIAVAQHDRAPTVFADFPRVTPAEHAQRLRFADVRQFPTSPDVMDWYCR